MTGHVQLPRRRIHAALWFRLLRSLLEELDTPISRCGAGASALRAGPHTDRVYDG